MYPCVRMISTLAVALFALCAAAIGAAEKFNVIVMLSDDMSAYYLDPNHPAQMPFIKSFAKRGTECTNAHTAITVCGPSRQSFLSGRHPDSTKIWTFERYLFQTPEIQTVAQFMAKNHGYETISFGKVTHEDHDLRDPLTTAQYLSGMWTTRQAGGGSSDAECRHHWFCKKDEKRNGDYRLLGNFQRYLSIRNTSIPLLAFVGFRKPHLEVAAPPAFVGKNAIVGTDTLQMSTPSSLGEDNTVIPFLSSLQRFDCFQEIDGRTVGKVPAYRFISRLRSHQKLLGQIRRYYFGAISWVDTLLQRLVDFVDASPAYQGRTAFVFMADHGFANGEHTMFCKNALFEVQTRIPFIAVPADQDATAIRNVVRTEPVSTVDLFPTIVQLGVGVVLENQAVVDSSNLPIDGRSILQKKSIISLYAFSVYPRCELVSSPGAWQCVVGYNPCTRRQNIFMGYAVRTFDTRYVEWRRFNDDFTTCDRPNIPPGMPPNAVKMLKRVNQIDPTTTGTDWSKTPVQREMFEHYPTGPSFAYGAWEKSNVLVDNIGNATNIIKATELSAAIRWRYDPTFGSAFTSMPCSGNGWVRLNAPEQWLIFKVGVQPSRTDVYCECLPLWGGDDCGTFLTP